METLRVMVFAKAPEPGKVKARLARTIGDVAAASLYRAMARRCIDNAEAALPGSVEIWCSPDRLHPFFGECVGNRRIFLHDQTKGDLGERMSNAFGDVLARSDAALLLGTDVPSISADDLRAAVASLRQGRDAVVCPSEDGGYGLIGLHRHDPRVFQDIDWGTGTVMAETRKRLSAMGWDWLELPMRWDVDEPHDLPRLATLPGFAELVAALPSP